MSFVGFPNQIEVTLGAAWNGSQPPGNPLSPNDVIVLGLDTTGDIDKYYSEGTNVDPSPTNRLRLHFYDSSPYQNREAFVNAAFLTTGTSINWGWLFHVSAYTTLD